MELCESNTGCSYIESYVLLWCSCEFCGVIINQCLSLRCVNLALPRAILQCDLHEVHYHTVGVRWRLLYANLVSRIFSALNL